MIGRSVPAEFVGLARAFRARIGAEDDVVGKAILRIMKPLEARRRRSATFRPEALIDAERAFRMLPSAGRLSLKVERDRHSLRIEEFRCAAGNFRFCRWGSDATDADVGVVQVELAASSWGALFVASDIVVSISLHALARRFQRGFDTSDDAILMELRQLALCQTDIIESWGDFAVSCDGGSWCGEVCKVETAGISAPMMAVRTFTPSGAPVRGVAFAAVAHA